MVPVLGRNFKLKKGVVSLILLAISKSTVLQKMKKNCHYIKMSMLKLRVEFFFEKLGKIIKILTDVEQTQLLKLK